MSVCERETGSLIHFFHIPPSLRLPHSLPPSTTRLEPRATCSDLKKEDLAGNLQMLYFSVPAISKVDAPTAAGLIEFLLGLAINVWVS